MGGILNALVSVDSVYGLSLENLRDDLNGWMWLRWHLSPNKSYGALGGTYDLKHDQKLACELRLDQIAPNNEFMDRDPKNWYNSGILIGHKFIHDGFKITSFGQLCID